VCDVYIDLWKRAQQRSSVTNRYKACCGFREVQPTENITVVYKLEHTLAHTQVLYATQSSLEYRRTVYPTKSKKITSDVFLYGDFSEFQKQSLYPALRSSQAASLSLLSICGHTYVCVIPEHKYFPPICPRTYNVENPQLDSPALKLNVF
jgi:hypothetical protein